MTGFFTRQLSELTAVVEAMLRRLLTSVGLLSVALIFLVAGFAFLSVALYVWVAQMTRPTIAALAVAGLEIFVAVLCLIAFRLKRPRPPRQNQDAPAKDAAAAQTGFAEKIDNTIAPLIAVLHEADMKPEEAALRLGASLTKQIGPFALVAFALAAGFMFGRRMTESRKD